MQQTLQIIKSLHLRYLKENSNDHPVSCNLTKMSVEGKET